MVSKNMKTHSLGKYEIDNALRCRRYLIMMTHVNKAFRYVRRKLWRCYDSIDDQVLPTHGRMIADSNITSHISLSTFKNCSKPVQNQIPLYQDGPKKQPGEKKREILVESKII